MRGGPGYVEFHDGTRQPFDQPQNTLDPRYPSCVEHRTGCICREAEWAEERNDLDAEWQKVRRVIGEVLAGHPDGCRCHGCEIARRLYLNHLIVLGVPR